VHACRSEQRHVVRDDIFCRYLAILWSRNEHGRFDYGFGLSCASGRYGGIRRILRAAVRFVLGGMLRARSRDTRAAYGHTLTDDQYRRRGAVRRPTTSTVRSPSAPARSSVSCRKGTQRAL
jgi:hypothetical protein